MKYLLILLSYTAMLYAQTQWVQIDSLPPHSYLTSVIYGDSHYVAVGSSGKILKSHDGISWDNHTIQTNNPLSSVTYGFGKYVAVARYSYGVPDTILSSFDGINWNGVTTGTPWLDLFSVIFNGSEFIAVGQMGDTPRYGAILSSIDGIVWSVEQSIENINFYSITYGNNQNIIVGRKHIIIKNGAIVYQNGIYDIDTTLSSIVFGNNQFITVGSRGVIKTSSDGSSWINRVSKTKSFLRSITYGNNTYVAVGDSGTIITSTDGMTWNKQMSATTKNLLGCTFGNDLFVAVGDRVMLTSRSGSISTEKKDKTSKENASFKLFVSGKLLTASLPMKFHNQGITIVIHNINGKKVSTINTQATGTAVHAKMPNLPPSIYKVSLYNKKTRIGVSTITVL